MTTQDERVEQILEAERAERRRIGEQAFHVEHYLALWKTDPTPANWRRVVESAAAYCPSFEHLREMVRRGRRIYFFETRGRHSALCRYTRVGREGKLYEQRFRKTSKTWTKER